MIVRHFDSSKEAVLLTDASRLFGLGYALGYMETDGSGKNVFNVVRCGSKGLTPTQQRYSTIELECLAIIWAIQKCSFFLKGLSNFLVLTDHRPLEGIFLKDLFNLPSPRLQHMCEKIAMCNFVVQWTPGKTHLFVDALSRAPLFAPKDLPGLEIDTAISCLSVTSTSSLDVIFSANDEDYRLLLSDVPNGTRRSNYSNFLKADFDSLSSSDGLVLLDSRHIVLPLNAVKPILRLLHATHSGVNKTLVLARGLYYWPGMVNVIKQLISSCSICYPHSPLLPWLHLLHLQIAK